MDEAVGYQDKKVKVKYNFEELKSIYAEIRSWQLEWIVSNETSKYVNVQPLKLNIYIYTLINFSNPVSCSFTNTIQNVKFYRFINQNEKWINFSKKYDNNVFIFHFPPYHFSSFYLSLGPFFLFINLLSVFLQVKTIIYMTWPS